MPLRPFVMRAWFVLWTALLCTPARAQAPTWTVDAAAFELNMSVVAAVSVSGVRLVHAGDRLAAFVGGEVRGVVGPTSVNGASVFFLPVYARTSGEPVTFRVYDAAANTVRELAPGLAFAANAIHGSATAPLAFAPGTGGSTGGGGTSGAWTVDPAQFSRTMGVVGVLRYADGTGAGVSDRVAAFVGSEVRGVASPVDVEGQRVFFLPVHANADGETVTFKVATGTDVRDAAGPLVFTEDAVVGTALAPHVWPVAGSAGTAGGTDDPSQWAVSPASFDRSMNVVAVLLTGGAASTDPADRVAAFVGSEVRGVASPVDVGGRRLVFLTVYGRTDGERIVVKAYDASAQAVLPVDRDLTFAADAVRGTVADPVALDARTGAPVADDPRAWAVAPAAFEQTMSAVASALVGSASVAGSGSRVAAFVGGEVRGVAAPTTLDGQPLYFLTVHGRPGDGAVTYRAYDASTGRVYAVIQGGAFEANRVDGRPDTPLRLNAAPAATSLFVYPGDANGDGRVNQNDLFRLTLYFGLTGPARLGASAQFERQLAATWAIPDAVLADMNGDGRINQNDLFPLGFNFGRQRPANGFDPTSGAAHAPGAPLRTSVSGLNGAPELNVAGPGGDVAPGDTVRLAVRLTGGDVRAVGFQVAYDTAAFEALGRIRGALFADAIDRGDALDLVRRDPGRFAYAATLTGTATPVGDGEVAVLRFRVRPRADGDYTLALASAEGMDGSGAALPLAATSALVRVAGQTTNVPADETRTGDLTLSVPSPSPVAARARFTAAVGAAQRVRIALYDLTGRQAVRLHDGLLVPGAGQAFDLDATGLPAGVYVLRAQGARGSVSRPVVVMH